MYKDNISRLNQDNSNLVCVKKSDGRKVICNKCKGAYNAKYLYRHKKNCRLTSNNSESHTEQMIPSVSNAKLQSVCPEFQRIISKMVHDDVHDIIQKDVLIQLIGEHIFLGRKPNKQKEAKIKARNAMRRLAKLLQRSESMKSSLELFRVENITKLEEAIISLCHSHDDFKPGLNVALGTLIKKAANFLRGHFLITQEKDKSRQVSEFREIFQRYYPRICSKAEYCLKEKRQRETRKPQALPNENNLQKLKTYLTNEIKKYSTLGIHSKKDYVHVRKVILARVTMLNARRGSEVCRLQMKDYEERNTWIEKKIGHLSDEEQQLLQKYSVCYVMGKGNSLVPVLLAKSDEVALDLLVDIDIRISSGVDMGNDYVFANTAGSHDSITGYNEIRDICNQLEIPVITASSLRHRASTLFWQMEGHTEAVVNSFMSHMGHSREIDKNIYCVPPAVSEITHVAPLMEQMDNVSV